MYKDVWMFYSMGKSIQFSDYNSTGSMEDPFISHETEQIL